MKKIKLFTVFSTLSKEDLRKVKKCVQSPIFNQKKEVEALFSQLRQYHPNLSSTISFRQKIYQKIYPNQPFNEYKFNKLSFELLEVIHQYFLYRHYQQNELERNVILAKAYHEQDLFAIHTQKNLQILKEINEYSFLDEELMGYKILTLTRLILDGQIQEENINEYRKEWVQALNHRYLYQKYLMQVGSEVLKARMKFQDEPIYFSNLEIDKIELLPQNIHLLRMLKKLIIEGEEMDFVAIQAAFFNVIHQLTHDDKVRIFNYLLSFLIKEINLGKRKYIATVFTQYQYGLENGVLINKRDKIDPGIFQNIVAFAILNKEFSWGEQFVKDYCEKIEAESRENIKNISVISLLFYQQKFEEAIKFSLDKRFKGLQIQLTLRGIILRSYFELLVEKEDYYLPFIYESQAFTKFLKRKEIPISKRNRYINLIKFLVALGKSMQNNEDLTVVIQKWKSKLNNNPIALKTWVIEKLEILGKN